MVIDEIAGIVFDIPHKIRDRLGWFQPEEYMRMIFHAIDDDGFLSLVLDNPRHIFEDFLSPFLVQKILASLHSKNDLDVDLGKCTSHVYL